MPSSPSSSKRSATDKASAVAKHLRRLQEKAKLDMPMFLRDTDSQDVALFNIQMAVQNCIDIAAHIISEQGLGVPASYNEMFYTLEENGYFENELTEKMVKAVSFRNLIVHEYAKLDLDRVHHIINTDINDLTSFIQAILLKSNLS